MRAKGLKICPAGSEVTDINECKDACISLGIRLSNIFKNGKPCFQAGNGACKQTGSVGSKALLVCKKLGKHSKCKVDTISGILLLMNNGIFSYMFIPYFKKASSTTAAPPITEGKL